MNRKTIFAIVGLNMATILVVATLLSFALAGATHDMPQMGAPPLIDYQGYLAGDDGVPLHGLYSLRLGVYAAASGGNPVLQQR